MVAVKVTMSREWFIPHAACSNHRPLARSRARSLVGGGSGPPREMMVAAVTLLLAALANILGRWRAGLSTASRQSQGYVLLLSQSSVAHDQPFMLSG